MEDFKIENDKAARAFEKVYVVEKLYQKCSAPGLR